MPIPQANIIKDVPRESLVNFLSINDEENSDAQVNNIKTPSATDAQVQAYAISIEYIDDKLEFLVLALNI